MGPDAYNARRCALGAGLPPSSTAMNVNRLCSSGLQAIVSGAQSILSGQARVVVAGGDESMSRQPFLTYGERAGWRLGSREAIDGTLSLLTDPFGGYQMGVTAEKVAEQRMSHVAQDAFALRKSGRAAAAIEEGRFSEQIVPIEAPRAAEPFTRDEHPRATTLEQLAGLKPVFEAGGSVTAGNSWASTTAPPRMLMLPRHASVASRRGCSALLGRDGIEPEIMGHAPRNDPEGARSPARRRRHRHHRAERASPRRRWPWPRRSDCRRRS